LFDITGYKTDNKSFGRPKGTLIILWMN